MLTTPLCDLLGIDHPILQGPLGPWHSVDLSAAVSVAGGLGLVGTTMRSVETLREDVALVRELTDAPFAIDLTAAPFDEQLFTAALDVRPAAVALGPDDLPSLAARAHAAGVLVLHHAGNARHAVLAANAGADVIACPSVLVAHVAAAVAPVPVVAAGGIAHGRELSSALTLGAHGVSVGTRFLAAPEAGLPDASAGSAAEIVHGLVEEAERRTLSLGAAP
jgi:nitronate monooxygenase/enoyl-[acyl-carrier protein] reductase II